MGALTSKLIAGGTGGSGREVPTADDVPAAAAAIIDGGSWLVEEVFANKSKAGNGGHLFRNAVAQAIGLPAERTENGTETFPQLESRTRPVSDAFSLEDPQASEVLALKDGNGKRWIAEVMRSSRWSDDEVPMEETKGQATQQDAGNGRKRK